MRGLLALPILPALFIAAPPAALADRGNSSSDTGTGNAQVVDPVALAHVSGTRLTFGLFTADTGGTVTVDEATGVGSASGGVTFVPGPLTALDGFTVTGDPDRSVAITTTSGTVTSGSDTMAFTTAPSAPSAVIVPGSGAAFNVGGTLAVAASQPPGSYTGSYNATVSYQ